MIGATYLLGPLLIACLAVAEDNVDVNYYQKFDNCEDAAVTVSYLDVLCDSNLTYYYGSGVHRGSVTCDDDDKATITVDFSVLQDIEDGDEIYMTMAAYSDSQLLYGESSTPLSSYVGYSCVAQGDYTFTTTVQLASDGTGDSEFVPLVRMAFSVEKESGSDLGGINLGQCDSTFDFQSTGSSGSNRVAIICGVVFGLLALVIGASLLLPRFVKQSAPIKPVKKRMDEADYGIVTAESSGSSEPSTSTPFLPPEQSKSEVASQDDLKAVDRQPFIPPTPPEPQEPSPVNSSEEEDVSKVEEEEHQEEEEGESIESAGSKENQSAMEVSKVSDGEKEDHATEACAQKLFVDVGSPAPSPKTTPRKKQSHSLSSPSLIKFLRKKRKESSRK